MGSCRAAGASHNRNQGFDISNLIYAHQRTAATEMLLPNGSIAVPCTPFSDGEVKSKYRNPGLDTAKPQRSGTAPFIFCSSPCLSASVVQRSCFWLRLRRAVTPWCAFALKTFASGEDFEDQHYNTQAEMISLITLYFRGKIHEFA